MNWQWLLIGVGIFISFCSLLCYILLRSLGENSTESRWLND